MYATAQFRRGLKIEIDGKLYVIVEHQHVKPGKGGAFVRTKLKNLATGQVVDQTFKSGAKVGKPDFEEKEMQYLFREGDNLVMMDLETFDQVPLPAESIVDEARFMVEGVEVKILFHNEVPIGVEIPFFVELEITETEPGVKGDTASGGSKPATLETGAVVQVPLFIGVGEKIRVDTRTGDYIERAK
ncbi:MAG: elongation factor P [Proteobacteria bacterium]|nr:elongation factor P [Pseudomonadota bacterium]MBU1741570.1 elongation factor P [Pseudomonadota bacterium]